MKKHFRLFAFAFAFFSFYRPAIAQKASDFFERGLYFKQQKNYDSAITCFSNALLLKLKYEDAYLERAFSYTKINRYDSAAYDYKTLSQFYSSNEDYLKTAGKYFLKSGIYAEAANSLSEYNKRRPSDETVIVDLINAQNGNKEYTNAVALSKKYEGTFGLNPYFIHAKFVAEKGAMPFEDLSVQAKQAAALTVKSAEYIKTPQRYHEFIADYATMLAEKNKQADAILLWDLLIKNESNNSYYYYTKAKNYFEVNNFDSSLAVIDQAFKLSSSNGNYFMLRAAIHQKMQNQIKACKDFETAFEILKNCESIEKCFECKKNENDIFGAEPFLRKAVELNCIGNSYGLFLSEIDSIKSAYRFEQNKPKIVLTSPLPFNNIIPLSSVRDTTLLKGYINDESKIKLIYINGLPLPPKNNIEFEIPVIASAGDSVILGAVDLWDNSFAEKFFFAIPADSVVVSVTINEPKADSIQIIPPKKTDISVFLSGKINCPSDKIKSVTVNGEPAFFKADDWSPDFTAPADIEKKDSVFIDVITLHGIQKRFSLFVNRKLSK